MSMPGAEPADRADDRMLVERLRAGDERAFTELVQAWSPGMLRLARTFVSGPQAAEDVVQEAWLGILQGLERFQGRSSLRTWALTIVVNRAKTRGVRDSRTVPGYEPTEAAGPTVDAGRFQGRDGRYPGGWTSAGVPHPWQQPDGNVIAGETQQLLGRALDRLPPRQRAVVILRDVQGCDSDEVCAIMDVTPGNQRALLHRGRAGLRAVLEDYYRSP